MGIGRSYVDFVNWDNPNCRSEGGMGVSSVSRLPYWRTDGEERVNVVWNSNQPGIKKDDCRKEGIEFIKGLTRKLLA